MDHKIELRREGFSLYDPCGWDARYWRVGRLSLLWFLHRSAGWKPVVSIDRRRSKVTVSCLHALILWKTGDLDVTADKA